MVKIMACNNCSSGGCGGCGGCGQCCVADDCAVNIQGSIDKLKEKGIDYCESGIPYDSKVCENIGKNKGIKGNSTSCADLQDALTVLMGDINNRICSGILCNEEELRRLLSDFAKASTLVDRLQNCSICGIWEKLEWLESIVVKDGYVSVTKVYTHTVPREKFVKTLENNVWWSGSPDVGESFISIPVNEMDKVDVVIAQPQVVGNAVHMVSVAVQSEQKQGDKYVVNFDTYEHFGNQVSAGVTVPFAVPIKFVVIGRKKVI